MYEYVKQVTEICSLVKITKSSRGRLWYDNKIGKEYWVQETTTGRHVSLYFSPNCFETIPEQTVIIRKGVADIGYINPEDCEVLQSRVTHTFYKFDE